MDRRDKNNYYLDLAETVLLRGTCLRRNYGAVIVRHDEVVSSGYTGAPRGRRNCCDLGHCQREKMGVARGTCYELCRSVHAEQNAIISASRDNMIGATLYLVGVNAKDSSYVENADCCAMCKRMIINSGIDKVVIRTDKCNYIVISVSEWIRDDDSLSGKIGY